MIGPIVLKINPTKFYTYEDPNETFEEKFIEDVKLELDKVTKLDPVELTEATENVPEG